MTYLFWELQLFDLFTLEIQCYVPNTGQNSLYRVISGNWYKVLALFSAYEATQKQRNMAKFQWYMYILILGFQKIQMECHNF